MVEIIVVLFNCPAVEKRCIDSVLKHTKEYKLTVYDNYPKNENLGKLWNRLISQSDCRYICLLNSDTVVEKAWLPKLLRGFEMSAETRIAGPTTDNSMNPQAVGKKQEGFEKVDSLGGFCYLFPKSHWEEMGGFNENFPFYGQESDFNRKTLRAGYHLCWVRNVFVHHEGSASIKAAEKRGEMKLNEERNKGMQYYNETHI